MPQFNVIREDSKGNPSDNRSRINHIGNINKIKFDKIIDKKVKASSTPISVRGIKLLQNKRELDVEEFSYDPELLNEYDIRVKLEKNGGWNTNIVLLIYLKTKSLQVEIGPKKEGCNFLVRSPISLYDSGLGPQKIPRIIHQTFIQDNVSERMYNTSNQWSKYNPEYEYNFYDNNDCRNSIKNNFNPDILEAYDYLIPGAYKTDLWRLCILYLYGGVYIDIPMEPLVSLRDVIEYKDEFIIPRDSPTEKYYLYNAFIASIPKHPILIESIKQIVIHVKTKWYNKGTTNYLAISGPCLIGNMVNKYLENKENTQYDLGNVIDNDNIVILEHLANPDMVFLKNKQIIKSRYDGYKQDRENMAGPHYSYLYSNRLVYGKKIENKQATKIVNGSLQSDILNCIYQTFSTNIVSNHLFDKRDTWVEKNPEYYYYFYKYDQHLDFIDEHFGERVTKAYQELSSLNAKINLWKYCILYEKGGIYCNIDSQCNTPLRLLINNKVNFIFVTDNTKNINNYFLATMSKNPIMLKMILEIVKLTEKLNYKTIENREVTEDKLSGTNGLSDVIKDLLEYDDDHIFKEGWYQKGSLYILILKYDNISNSVITDNNAIIRVSYPEYESERLLYK